MGRLVNDDLTSYFNGEECGCSHCTLTEEEEELFNTIQKEARSNSVVIEVRDRLNNLSNLVSVLADFLIHTSLNKGNIMAAEAMFFFALKEIKELEEELRKA